jgi:hypothetical protein
MAFNRARAQRIAFFRAHAKMFLAAAAGYTVLSAILLVFLPWPSRSFREGAIAAGACWAFWAMLSLDGSEPKRRGGEAERWTSTRLRKSWRDGWRRIDHLDFGDMDVDHVLYGQGGVIAIETKFTSFPWTTIGNDLQGPLGRPLDQARWGARRIRLLLRSKGVKVDVVPALAVWGPGTEGLRASNVGGVCLLVGREEKDWAHQLPPCREPLSQIRVTQIDRVLRDFVEMRDSYDHHRGRASTA